MLHFLSEMSLNVGLKTFVFIIGLLLVNGFSFTLSFVTKKGKQVKIGFNAKKDNDTENEEKEKDPQ